VLLVLDSLLDLGGQEVTSLLFLDPVDLSERSSSELLDDLVPLVKNFLSFFEHI
jgi:hypothetical protein